MSVETPPWALQAGSHPARTTRNMLAALMSAPVQAETAGISLSAGGAHGVCLPGDLVVTQNGTPNMSVNVAAGRALVRSTEAGSLGAGVYTFLNDGVVNLTIAAADATNPRRDLVVAQIRDAEYSGGSNDARLFVVTGTPAASPVDPAVPNSCVVLARVAVAALASSITNANITDLRVRARTAWNNAWGTVGYAQVTAAQSGITTQADLTGLSLTWTAIANRRYKIRFYGEINGSVAGDLLIAYITDGANVAQQRHIITVPALVAGTGYSTITMELVQTPSAGSVTRKARLERNSGTGTASLNAGSALPAFILVEDIGPA